LLASLKLSDTAIAAAAAAAAASTAAASGSGFSSASITLIDAFSTCVRNIQIAFTAPLTPGAVLIDFSTASLIAAVLANIFAAFKGPETRKLLLADRKTDSIKQRMGNSRNQYAIIYIIAWFAAIPVMLFTEKKVLGKFWKAVFVPGSLRTTQVLSNVTHAVQWLRSGLGLASAATGDAAAAGAVLPVLQPLQDIPFLNPMALYIVLAGVWCRCASCRAV